MAARPVLDVRLDDRLELRKAHPCGSRTWTVTRLGADIGLACEGCGRRILLERRDLERQLARFLDRDDADAAGDEVADPARVGDSPPRDADDGLG